MVHFSTATNPGALLDRRLQHSGESDHLFRGKHSPVPAKSNRSQRFLQARWEVLAAVDFTTVEVWTRGGLVTCYILVAMQLSTRRIQIASVTPNPDAAWVQQIARYLTDCYDGFLRESRYVLVDRDTSFLAFRGVLEGSETKPVLLPPKSPNLNANLERYMRSMKYECLNRIIFFGDRSLRKTLAEFEAHYHGEHNHQGLGNNLIEPEREIGRLEANIACRNRLTACSATTTAKPPERLPRTCCFRGRNAPTPPVQCQEPHPRTRTWQITIENHAFNRPSTVCLTRL